jgi:hypothetical protein
MRYQPLIALLGQVQAFSGWNTQGMTSNELLGRLQVAVFIGESPMLHPSFALPRYGQARLFQGESAGPRRLESDIQGWSLSFFTHRAPCLTC